MPILKTRHGEISKLVIVPQVVNQRVEGDSWPVSGTIQESNYLPPAGLKLSFAGKFTPEIMDFIKVQFLSNFRAMQPSNKRYVFWSSGELKKGLEKIIAENPELCGCVKRFASLSPPLNLDIFALITDGRLFELLIVEVKGTNVVGLLDWSRLVGCCLMSGARYGLLINIGSGASQSLREILTLEDSLSHICSLVDGSLREHFLGLMTWNKEVQNIEYSNLGAITSLSQLCAFLNNDLSSL